MRRKKPYRLFSTIILLVFFQEVCAILLGLWGGYTIVDPTPVPTATRSQPTSSMACTNLHLTSPLEGMANGMQTFYWDALANAVTYRINIYDKGASLGGWDAPAGQTNLTVDVSSSTIGGESYLTVELLASDAAGHQCRQLYNMGREAAPAQAAPATATPTCAEEPRRC